MKPNTTTLGRPPIKSQMIENSLRERIVTGDLPPGSRVPTRRELASHYDAMLNTVHGALTSLERDGFVVAKGNRGTFVSPHPPHLSHIALVFPIEPQNSGWLLYWDHLAKVARRIVREQGLRLTIYTGIQKQNPGKDFQILLDDVRNDRLAGIIFPSRPFGFGGTDVLEKHKIPRVMMGAKDTNHPFIGKVDLDHVGFAQKVAAYFKRKKIKSVGILQQVGIDHRLVLDTLIAVGISCPYHFQQAVSLDEVKWARNSMRLLFDSGRAVRPEALIVLNDNLCLPALEGIADAGLSIPEDLEVLTHSNFPWQDELPSPVTRLGYDMEALLTTFIEELEFQRKGQSPRSHLLRAVFEDELRKYS